MKNSTPQNQEHVAEQLVDLIMCNITTQKNTTCYE